jgi:hypothetical protein
LEGGSQVVAAVKQASAFPWMQAKATTHAQPWSGAAPLFWWPLGETSHQSVQFRLSCLWISGLASDGRMEGKRGPLIIAASRVLNQIRTSNHEFSMANYRSHDILFDETCVRGIIVSQSQWGKGANATSGE